MNYDSFCSQIFEISPKIRYVSIYHKHGELLAGGMRKGVESYLSKEETESSMRQAALGWSAQKMVSPKIGDPHWAVAKYDKVFRITMPLNESELILVSTEPQVNPYELVEKIITKKEKFA